MSSVTFPSIGSGEKIPAKLIVPDGSGPFPAIVIAHDCSGFGPRSGAAPERWADAKVRVREFFANHLKALLDRASPAPGSVSEYLL